MRSRIRASARLLRPLRIPSRGFATNFTEVLEGDDYPLDYYPDGYPRLPACLDRRHVPLAEAA